MAAITLGEHLVTSRSAILSTPLPRTRPKMRRSLLVAMSCGLALGDLPACVVDSSDARQLDTEICEVSGTLASE